MKWHDFRLSVVFLAFACGMLALWGGQWVLRQYTLHLPEQALAKSPVVASYSIKEENNRAVINVRLKNNTNLEDDWQQLDKTLSSIMGAQKYSIQIMDNPDSRLKDLYYRCQFPIYEGIAQKNFQAMAGAVNDEAGAAHVTANIYMDENNVYLELKDSGHCLQAVFPCHMYDATNSGSSVNLQGGGAGV